MREIHQSTIKVEDLTGLTRKRKDQADKNMNKHRENLKNSFKTNFI